MQTANLILDHRHNTATTLTPPKEKNTIAKM